MASWRREHRSGYSGRKVSRLVQCLRRRLFLVVLGLSSWLLLLSLWEGYSGGLGLVGLMRGWLVNNWLILETAVGILTVIEFVAVAVVVTADVVYGTGAKGCSGSGR